MDYPETENRGMHIIDADIKTIKSHVGYMAQHKMNISIIHSKEYFRLNRKEYEKYKKNKKRL